MTESLGTQLVTFRLGDDHFAADIHAVERVLKFQLPTPVPNVPAWIDGVLEYQGRVVPVINLRARFEMPAVAPAAETRTLIFNVGGDWVAAVVDAVIDVAAIDDAHLSPPPPLFRGLAAEYLRGVVRRGDRLVMFLDVPHLLSTVERLQLEQAASAKGLRGE